MHSLFDTISSLFGEPNYKASYLRDITSPDGDVVTGLWLPSGGAVKTENVIAPVYDKNGNLRFLQFVNGEIFEAKYSDYILPFIHAGKGDVAKSAMKSLAKKNTSYEDFTDELNAGIHLFSKKAN